jgi:nucleoside-diphosphate kinase
MGGTERVLSFVAEWFDPHPQIVKQYLLKYHCGTNEVEMKDIQTKRVFLRKTKLPPSLKESDFFIGAKILLLSRDLKVIEYADAITRTLLESLDELTVCVLSPALYESLGDVVSLVEGAGFTLVDLTSTRLGDVEDAYAAADLLRADPDGLSRPGPLVVMSFRGSNSVAAVRDLVRSSSFAGRGLSCPSDPDEASAYANFLATGRRSRTTATLEECTCCVIKPHAVRERIVGAILGEIVSRGFVISAVSTFRLERAAAAEFLEVYGGVVPEYRDMVDEMCSGLVVALEVRLLESGGGRAPDRQGEVVETFRAHAGPWDVNMGE